MRIDKILSFGLKLILIGVFLYYVFILIGVYFIQDSTKEVMNNNIVEFSSEDKLLKSSIEKTRDSLRKFISEFENNQDKDKLFLTKVELFEGNISEHIWLEIVKLDNQNSVGLINNDPIDFKKYKYLDTVHFNINKSEDIMIVKNDSILFGGFLLKELNKLD